jgi:hypothetical protein
MKVAPWQRKPPVEGTGGFYTMRHVLEKTEKGPGKEKI